MSVRVKELTPGSYRLVMMAVDSVGRDAQNRVIDLDITE